MIATAGDGPDQTLLLHHRVGRTVSCFSCKADIGESSLCFSLDALFVPLSTDSACVRKFYICAKPICVLKLSPPWTNIRKPTSFKKSAAVTDEERDDISRKCNLTYVN